MREHGFMPFSAVGVVIVLLVVAMVGQAVGLRHQRSLNTVDDASSSALLTIATSVQNDLRAAARYAVYDALWGVSKDADNYVGDEARKSAIESLAARYFAKQIATLPNAYAKHDARVEFELGDSDVQPVFNLREGGGGYVLVNVMPPKGTRVKISSWDNDLVLDLPCENLEIFIDSRYFLLQRKMQEFIDGLDSVGTSWVVMEYISAWAGAWLRGKVTLSTSRSKSFFELAWAGHELGTFGSADYAAAALGIVNATAGTSEASGSILSELSNPTLTITPIRAADVETMKGYLDRALEALTEASAALGGAREYVRRAMDEVVGFPENFDNLAQVFENARGMLEKSKTSVGRAQTHVLGAGQQFKELVDFTARTAEQNVLMAALHESLVTQIGGDFIDGTYPSPREQVAWGVGGADAKLVALEARTSAITQLVHANGDIPQLENILTNFYGEISTSIQNLLTEPAPKRWVEFDCYAEPESYEGEPPGATRERAPIYIDDEQDGTIGGLKAILRKARNNLNTMGALAGANEPALDEIESIEIDESLKQKLELDVSGLFNIDREQLYELLSPPPVQPEPGLSVFHDFNIKDPSYRREDPAGWFGSSTATPIPLWFIGITLWWAQWDITLELEDGAIEEVFDFDNPTLLQTHEFPDGPVDVHKPLAYRRELPDKTFNFRLVIISLRPFSMS